MKLLLCLVSLAVCSAHVRLRYQGQSIRNANGPQADGRFSTSGPCGGVTTFGANGINKVSPGQAIKMKIAYNGGHKSANNEFKMGWSCTRPNSDAIFRKRQNPMNFSTPLARPAADSSTAGYEFDFAIPAEAKGMFCTASALDQRDWGGCVDFEVLAAALTPTVAPAPTPVGQTALYNTDLSGYFKSWDVTSECTEDSPDCCCLHGSFDVTHTKGQNTAMIKASLGCHRAELPLPDAYTADTLSLTKKPIEANVEVVQKTVDTVGVSGTMKIGLQNFEVSVFDGMVSLVNVDDKPQLCSWSPKLTMSRTKPVDLWDPATPGTLDPTPIAPSGENGASALSGVTAAALLVAGLFIYL